MLIVEHLNADKEVTVHPYHSSELQVSAPWPPRGYQNEEVERKGAHSRIGDVTQGQEEAGVS